jgi:hypothetical protein
LASLAVLDGGWLMWNRLTDLPRCGRPVHALNRAYRLPSRRSPVTQSRRSPVNLRTAPARVTRHRHDPSEAWGSIRVTPSHRFLVGRSPQPHDALDPVEATNWAVNS